MWRWFSSAQDDPALRTVRPGLAFAFFNAPTWQIGLGTPMVLFAEQLGASPAQVGLAYAWVFVLTPVQIFATALLPRFGFKRVMLGGWRMRSFFLVVPMALTMLAAAWGPRTWMVQLLVWSVFFFCLFRAVGASASTPWLYAIVPPAVRGRYFASDQYLAGVAGVLTLLGCAALFAFLPVFPALLLQYGIAVLGSLLSYRALAQLPDAPRPRPVSLMDVARATPQHLLTRSTFRAYLLLALWFSVVVTPIVPFGAYYLKVGPGLSLSAIMVFEVARYLGVILAAWTLARRIDVTGARPFMLVGLWIYAAVAAFWWLYLRWEGAGVAGVLGSYFLIGVATSCWSIASLNYLPKIVPEAERPLMVSIHGAVTALGGGLAPIVWGWFLRTESAAGPALSVPVFGWFFVSSFASSCLLAWFSARLPEERSVSVEPIMIGNAVLRPMRAMTYLVNLVDVRGLDAPAPPAAPSSSDEERRPGGRN